ncbi:MAG TPA: hypothetical protein VM659_27710 [Dongiaceae bacterium]|nr:hypothetical protein [Dongiaceae bacterium]
MSQQGTHWLWHWSGRCFGYRQGDRLLADDGQQLGRFVAERIFDRDGRYIGEIRAAGDGGEGRRLATRLADLALQHDGFEPVRGDRRVLPADQPPLPMPVGYRRFPLASELKRHFAPVPAPAARPADALQPSDAAPAKPAARSA